MTTARASRDMRLSALTIRATMEICKGLCDEAHRGAATRVGAAKRDFEQVSRRADATAAQRVAGAKRVCAKICADQSAALARACHAELLGVAPCRPRRAVGLRAPAPEALTAADEAHCLVACAEGFLRDAAGADAPRRAAAAGLQEAARGAGRPGAGCVTGLCSQAADRAEVALRGVRSSGAFAGLDGRAAVFVALRELAVLHREPFCAVLSCETAAAAVLVLAREAGWTLCALGPGRQPALRLQPQPSAGAAAEEAAASLAGCSGESLRVCVLES
jgi:hypothetical protein